MSGPAFHDCAFPEDCECRKRGYELERESCAVPGVRQAAADLGIDLNAVGAKLGLARRPGGASPPRPAAMMFGTVMLLGNTDNLADDVFAAVQAMGGTPQPMTQEQIARIIANANMGRGLRVEAGYATGPLVVILFTRTELLASGHRATAYLTLMHVPQGDAVLWNIAVSGADDSVTAADYAGLERILSMLRAAAGGPSTEQNAYPGEEELEE